MEYTPPLQYLLRQSLKRYISLILITIGLFILVRFYEILFISWKAGYPAESITYLLSGIWFDLLLALRLSAFLLLPYLLIDHYNQIIARVFYAVISVAVVLADVVLLLYFSVTKVPLGTGILGAPINEIHQMVRNSGGLNLYFIFPVAFFLLLGVYSFYKWSAIKVSSFVVVLFTLFLLFSTLPFDANPDPADFKNEYTKNISANKFSLFCCGLTDPGQKNTGP